MQWTDKAIVLSSSKYAEHSLIIRVITETHGLHTGLIRSARKMNSICQAGNMVNATWKARLEDHLGTFSLESEKAFFADVFDDRIKLAALLSICDVVKNSLPDREPHPEIFAAVLSFLYDMEANNNWHQSYVTFEIELLKNLGFGLDLDKCTVTGKKDLLLYVSPKTGRAVCEESGRPYSEKLLHLPKFLRPTQDITHKQNAENMTEIVDGMRLTQYFLNKYVFCYGQRDIPLSRDIFIQKLCTNYF